MKPFEGRVPVAEITGQVAPLCSDTHDPKDGLHEPARISARLAGMGCFSKAIRFNDCPLGVAQNETGQGCFPAACNLEPELTHIGNPERQQTLVIDLNFLPGAFAQPEDNWHAANNSFFLRQSVLIPDYQSLMRPVLNAASSGARKISDVVEEISDQLELSVDERSQMLPSGKQTVITNRVHWARSYLKQAGLVTNIKRGWYELSDRGREVLYDPAIKLDAKYLERFDEFQDFRSRTKGDHSTEAKAGEQDVSTPARTPDESLQDAHSRLERALASSLLDSVRSSSPQFFESLIVDLFIAMGYGGASEDAGRALGQSGDNGVDGVIDQDPLGVDQIYLQAKRYGSKNGVGSGGIRDFYGALSIKKATKGIFVTTSYFTSSAEQTARDLGSRIVLIDGKHLAALLMKYNIGCRDKEVLHIKQIDEAYFEEE